MDSSETVPVSDDFRRARVLIPRRVPGEMIDLRSRRSCETDTAPAPGLFACLDCGHSLQWRHVDHTHGVMLCRTCARVRSGIDPMPRDGMELAGRLDRLRHAISCDLATALALLEGTPFEADAKIWGNTIRCALDAPGLEYSAYSMSSTIARIRRPIIHSGSEW